MTSAQGEPQWKSVPVGSHQTPESLGRPVGSALPEEWNELWGEGQKDLARKQLEVLRDLTAELAAPLSMMDLRKELSPLIGASGLSHKPVHRWFSYKEGYAPEMPTTVLDLLEGGSELVIADFFGGVATTAISLREDSRVHEVHSLEYSPLAQMVGSTKLSWPSLNPQRLRHQIDDILDYRIDRSLPPPELAAFHDERIFSSATVASLQSAQKRILGMPSLRGSDERDFFLVGLAAVVEDASFAMKDGRALRILNGRCRRNTSLRPREVATTRWRDPVKKLLANQLSAMIEDLEGLQDRRAIARRSVAWHIRGDARRLRAAKLPNGAQAFPPDSIHVGIYSPPYLNFIDYSEVYKLELWLMGHIRSQAAFRRLRLGTLRSHPSVRFGERPAPQPQDHRAVDLVHRLAGWLAEYGARPEAGLILRHYFEDMHASFAEQFRVLKPGGVIACAVANSTFSRRNGNNGDRVEEWRMPVMTDVILAGLAQMVGFTDVQLWYARDLRPRNVSSGRARESVVVAHKPSR